LPLVSRSTLCPAVVFDDFGEIERGYGLAQNGIRSDGRWKSSRLSELERRTSDEPVVRGYLELLQGMSIRNRVVELTSRDRSWPARPELARTSGIGPRDLAGQ